MGFDFIVKKTDLFSSYTFTQLQLKSVLHVTFSIFLSDLISDTQEVLQINGLWGKNTVRCCSK